MEWYAYFNGCYVILMLIANLKLATRNLDI